jgi:hypothetical protein
MKIRLSDYEEGVIDGREESAEIIRQQQEKLTKYELRYEEQRKRIDELEAYQKHDVELAEAIGWDKGYEAGRQLGMKQERALWELAASTQEIMDTHPVKEQYKFGVDWSKDGNAVTVLKICEDGVAEVVFMDYQEVTHPAKTLTDEVYFCSRCGKRLGDGIHTCTPPADISRKAQEK